MGCSLNLDLIFDYNSFASNAQIDLLCKLYDSFARSEANQYCQSIEGELFMPVSPASIDQAQDFLVKQFRNYSSGDVSGYWTAACINQESGNICKVIRLDDKNQVTFAEEDNQRKFTALCSLKKSDSAVETHTYIYTCQCDKGYGYENCRCVFGIRDHRNNC